MLVGVPLWCSPRGWTLSNLELSFMLFISITCSSQALFFNCACLTSKDWTESDVSR